ncbi:hypothetical protein PRK78_003407 [Emydomyces testavorans]|uniref:MIT domain-containing protein n=1 Tax=Emydomyces testavorans TaxID=2070801 RepID=A0AAF0IHJ0_9EURO|nr:hypothetical protein PRK78_003407 [Emydomyces testavorans]
MDATQERDRRRRGSSQKSMLSKALQKANTAVLLDNAANYEGAIEAYSDACDLLMQVMRRTEGPDEKQKLEEIRTTYTTRIAELRRLGLSSRTDGKALPERPLSAESFSPSAFSFRSDIHDELDDEDMYVIETATATRILNNPSYKTDPSEPRTLAPSQIPPRRQSLLPSAFDDEVRFWKPTKPGLHREGSSTNLPTLDEQLPDATPAGGVSSETDFNGAYHQSPSRDPPLRPRTQSQQSEHQNHVFSNLQPTPDLNSGSTSWLDNGDSGGSSVSSLRSRSSSLYLRRRERMASGGTEAAFDAALDAAVEAAYNEGLEPVDESDDMSTDDDIVLNVRKNVERAKQKVREAEMEVEAISAKGRETRRIQKEAVHDNYPAIDANYEDEEAEEEELILEEMMDVFDFDLQSKSALPRQSGSSGFSGRTWGSSIASNAATTGTSLSTLAEEDILPSLDAQLVKTLPTAHTLPQSALATAASLPPLPPPPPLPHPPSAQPPTPHSTLPPLPTPTPSTITPNTPLGPSVRARRLSGRNAKELSIETSMRLPLGAEGPRTVPASMTAARPPSSPSKAGQKTGIAHSWQNKEPKTATQFDHLKSSRIATGSVESLPIQSPMTTFAETQHNDDEDDYTVRGFGHRTVSKVASAPDTLRKDTSSSHSKSARGKKLSGSTEEAGKVPESPFVTAFSSATLRKGPHTSLSTAGSAPVVGPHYLFDRTLHSPMTPGYPNPSTPNAPVALEPCPQSFLLRPFWLMRCLYQSIAHPRGAYLTTKLFIPRDVWRVKNVKLKAVEEKVSNCDLLTAALLKVAQVDTNDADAVLEEMQSLENILDQVQAVWSKKLGNEVGVHGAMNLFKSSSSSDDLSSVNEPPSRSTSGGGKSYLPSWRKLRAKSSGPSAVPSTSGAKDIGKDNLTLNSLPMDHTLSFRPPKRNLPELKCSGPNANYMNALARLCDAAQVIGEFLFIRPSLETGMLTAIKSDQIARQVEDPGLKHSSQTLVGLELSTRHAAEFFGFYVCRFALHDIGLMIDKFIKRGSEWVLV